MGLRMQPRTEKFFTLFSRGRLERRRERGHSHGVRRRAARALGGAPHNACTTPSTPATTPLKSASQMRAAARTIPPR